ncbi:15420_t:CDS:1, partial [Acaulospora colombiana]
MNPKRNLHSEFEALRRHKAMYDIDHADKTVFISTKIRISPSTCPLKGISSSFCCPVWSLVVSFDVTATENHGKILSVALGSRRTVL